jgi:hypothetical protein
MTAVLPVYRTAPLRLVLFGLPGSGKTSLLAALVQATQKQTAPLKLCLRDPEGKLQQLQEQWAHAPLPSTTEALVTYPAVWEPEGEAGSRPAVPLLFCDSAGGLTQQWWWAGNCPPPDNNPLWSALVQADALLLCLDASVPREMLGQDLARAAHFLRLLEEQRSRQVAVAGLPVYVVLTKCDLLARDSDSLPIWLERLEDYKRLVSNKLRQARAAPAPRHAFGQVTLHAWATAAKPPPLAQATPEQAPQGVVELFHQVLPAAQAYRACQHQAHRRLYGLTLGLLAFLGLLCLLLGFFYLRRPSPAVGALEAEVRRFRAAQGETARQRLREPLEDRLRQLQRLRSDPAFAHLPPDLRRYVDDSWQELQDYRRYYRELLERAQDPRLIRTYADLDRLEKVLNELPLPEKYQAEWQDTPAGRLRRRWQQEAQLLRREARKAEQTFKDLATRWQKIQSEPLTAEQRQRKQKELLLEADSLPYRDDNRDHYLPDSQLLTYDNVLQFEPVAEALRQWRLLRQASKVE